MIKEQKISEVKHFKTTLLEKFLLFPTSLPCSGPGLLLISKDKFSLEFQSDLTNDSQIFTPELPELESIIDVRVSHAGDIFLLYPKEIIFLIEEAPWVWQMKTLQVSSTYQSFNIVQSTSKIYQIFFCRKRESSDPNLLLELSRSCFTSEESKINSKKFLKEITLSPTLKQLHVKEMTTSNDYWLVLSGERKHKLFWYDAHDFQLKLAYSPELFPDNLTIANTSVAFQCKHSEEQNSFHLIDFSGKDVPRELLTVDNVKKFQYYARERQWLVFRSENLAEFDRYSLAGEHITKTEERSDADFARLACFTSLETAFEEHLWKCKSNLSKLQQQQNMKNHLLDNYENPDISHFGFVTLFGEPPTAPIESVGMELEKEFGEEALFSSFEEEMRHLEIRLGMRKDLIENDLRVQRTLEKLEFSLS